MSAIWPRVKLGDVLTYRHEFITIDDLATYKRPRVQLHAQGVVLRDEIPGALIKTKTQQICHVGEFLVAEIDAKVGGFGIVPESLDGAIVSCHYFLFTINEVKLDRRFLDYFSRMPAFRDQIAAQGSTNYAAIRSSNVLQYEIPLPPLHEQRRLVARIEKLAARLDEARRLNKEAKERSHVSVTSARRSLFGEKANSTWMPIAEFVSGIENGKSPQCESRAASNHEWGVLKVGAISFGSFEESQNKALPLSLHFDTSYEIRRGDFLMSRANTKELVGACAIVGGVRPKLLLSDKTFRFHFKENAPVLGWFDHVLKSPALRDQIEAGASGTSPTMKNISKEKVLRLLVPRHSPAEQRRIVAYLDELQKKTTDLKALQAKTSVELDALMPSILNRAFRGEL